MQDASCPRNSIGSDDLGTGVDILMVPSRPAIPIATGTCPGAVAMVRRQLCQDQVYGPEQH